MEPWLFQPREPWRLDRDRRPILAPLMDFKTFSEVQIGYAGTSLFWKNSDGDLAIDAVHLRKLGDEQRIMLTT